MDTIYDVAKLAGVSASTVSRVINQRPGVNQDTVERVRNALEQTDFRPRWKAAPPKSVGVVVFPHTNCLADPFNAHLLSAIGEALFTEGYILQLIPRTQSDGPLSDISLLATTHQIQGVIVIPMHPLYGFSERLERGNIQVPHVVVGAEKLPSLEHRVGSNDYAAGKQAARYLWQLGHRRFGLVTASLRDQGHQSRVDGFVDALTDLGVHPDNILNRQYEDAQISVGESAAAEMLLTPNRPTAFVLTNSRLAIGFSRGARKLGIRIPDDVSLLGFEDADELSTIDPPMTVMRQPTRQLGELAVRLLLAQVQKNGTEDLPRLLDLPLMVRESTAVVPTTNG